MSAVTHARERSGARPTCPVCSGRGRITSRVDDYSSDRGEVTDQCPDRGCIGGKLYELTCRDCGEATYLEADAVVADELSEDGERVLWVCGECAALGLGDRRTA